MDGFLRHTPRVSRLPAIRCIVWGIHPPTGGSCLGAWPVQTRKYVTVPCDDLDLGKRNRELAVLLELSNLLANMGF